MEKIEKDLPTVSFTTKKKEKLKRKGIKVNKIKKPVYNSDSENTPQQPLDRLEQDKQALSNKLSNILSSNKKIESHSAPILLKSQQTLNQQIQKEKEKKKAQKEKELEKELLKNKDYKPIEILLTPEERDLLRLAKKGVIKLFNAVTQHQSSGMTASVDSKSKNISKNQFLETLKNSKVKKSGDDSESDEDEYGQDGGEEWDVLKDDYLIKNEWDGEEQD
ncbi:hypothetical protein DICPUDRAFT_90621 [Dictyostelium purpureum]|uniref:RRP15-like protein n=1 Tax=Dictyostelium purpureum TaxID=5786 RepID=F1A3S8_DICPU|nr:uncharacterized protein DICPUDRAFT_90621 [Dictyostelium purpureum]EGC29155.1 hypothetical protein DICPUDRAFT_90621 [Dictyostelium purpureum]|eukprot:XP_003294322.1 hypothetical protein DICPUDRAFT_90621 [Dictyostelium purpureum]